MLGTPQKWLPLLPAARGAITRSHHEEIDLKYLLKH